MGRVRKRRGGDGSHRWPDYYPFRTGRDAPSSVPVRVLLVEPGIHDARRIGELLMEPGSRSFHLVHADHLQEARRRLSAETFDAVLFNLSQPGGQDGGAINSLKAGIPVIAIVDTGGEALAHYVVRQGAAQDFLVRGHLTRKILTQALLYGVERRRMLNLSRKLRETECLAPSIDPLTQFPNRESFLDRLNTALSHARRQVQMVAVLLLNLDGFRLVHDTLGPTVGESLLRGISARLAEGASEFVRQGDTIARLSADEFALVLTGLSTMPDISKAAERILQSFSRPFVVDGREFYIGANVGISLYPFDGSDTPSLLRNADLALRRSRERGGQSYEFYLPAVNDKYLTRLELQNSLRMGLSRDEFQVYYMPQLDLLTGRIASVEALVRWNHPTLGLVNPVEFIPLAEETSLILPIGEKVLRTACLQARAWHRQGLAPIGVSVNFSARQMLNQDPVALVHRVLDETGLEPRSLELEITESTLMSDAQASVSTLRQLKETGIGLAIDDFGVGYSSLSYLKSFPIDALKVDRSFVREVVSRTDDAAIVTAIIAMAHGLNLKVIAEGVETPEHLAWLKDLRCDEAQGYLFSRPMPAEEASLFLARDGAAA